MPLARAAPVDVELQPNPLPDSTLRAQVFADIAPTDGTLDAGEPGLAGFVGHINDYLGVVTTDVYGNPLCTDVRGRGPGHPPDPARQPRRRHGARWSTHRAATASATPTAC